MEHDTPYSGSVHSSAPRVEESRGFFVRTRGAARAGLTMGSTLAIVISWSVHHSIVWALVHGLLSWIYVVYYALTR